MSCIWTENTNNGYRGLPSGYVALLEQRLLESELVIFELLSKVYNDNTTGMREAISHQERDLLSEFTKAQSKLKKVDEWKNYPLNTPGERHAWWLRKRDIIDLYRTGGDAQGHRHSRSDVLQDASPASTCLTPNAQSEASLPHVEPQQGHVAELIGWHQDMNDTSNIGNHVVAQGVGSSDTIQAALVAPAESPVEQPTPSLRASNTDRWRKYF